MKDQEIAETVRTIYGLLQGAPMEPRTRGRLVVALDDQTPWELLSQDVKLALLVVASRWLRAATPAQEEPAPAGSHLASVHDDDLVTPGEAVADGAEEKDSSRSDPA